MAKISVLIPCYNEEQGVANVIKNIPKDKFKKLGYDIEVIVINNNSTDNTTQVAEKAGAKVFLEKRKGKGRALLKGFYSISKDTDYIVMIDGDDTYKTHEMLRLIEPLENNFCDVVVGSRLAGKLMDHSMTRFNRFGNWFLSFLVRTYYCGNVTDVCTGYFAWKREVIEELRKHLVCNGFNIEMEMITKMAKLKYSIYSVPITYDPRKGNSTLHPLRDGSLIFHTFLKNLHWKPK